MIRIPPPTEPGEVRGNLERDMSRSRMSQWQGEGRLKRGALPVTTFREKDVPGPDGHTSLRAERCAVGGAGLLWCQDPDGPASDAACDRLSLLHEPGSRNLP